MAGGRPGLSRRDALRAAGAVLLGSACSGPAAPDPPPAPSRRAVIVGAGLAGLTAALELEAGGWAVEVLEAQPAVGGRVRTVSGAPLPGGAMMEAGSSRIEAADVAVQDLAQRLGVTLVEQPRRAAGLDAAVCLGGAPRRREEVLAEPGVAEGLAAFDAALQQVVAPGQADVDLADLLEGLDLAGTARLLIEADLLARFASASGGLSAQFVAASWQRDGATTDPAAAPRLVEGGASRLLEALRDAVGGQIRTNIQVSAIDDGSSEARVTHSRGSASGDAVVLAVPAAAARRIQQPHDELIPRLAGVGEGPVTTALMVYESTAWLDAGLDGTLTGDTIPSRTRSAGAADGAGLLVVEGAGGVAVQTAQLADQTGALKQAVDACTPAPPFRGGRPAVTVRWADDEGTAGRTIHGPGWRDAVAALQQPLGRIHLAGDHVAEVAPGTMEGAVISGRRAAAAILASA